MSKEIDQLLNTEQALADLLGEVATFKDISKQHVETVESVGLLASRHEQLLANIELVASSLLAAAESLKSVGTPEILAEIRKQEDAISRVDTSARELKNSLGESFVPIAESLSSAMDNLQNKMRVILEDQQSTAKKQKSSAAEFESVQRIQTNKLNKMESSVEEVAKSNKKEMENLSETLSKQQSEQLEQFKQIQNGQYLNRVLVVLAFIVLILTVMVF